MKMILLLLSILVLTSVACADIASEVDVHVQVNSAFELSVDRTNIDFETMKPGEVKDGVPEAGIRVSAKTNSGRPWALHIHANRELSNGEAFIPNESFFWYGWKDRSATGTFYGSDRQIFTATPALVYTPSPEEYNNLRLVDNKLTGTDVFIKFGLRVPVSQNSGDYHTVVRFTMTE